MSLNETENLSRIELISKLKEIYRLYQNTVEIEEEMEDFVPEDNYPRNITLPLFPGNYRSEEERRIWTEDTDHADEDAVKTVAYAYDLIYHPKKPDEPVFKECPKSANAETEKTKKNMGCLTIGAAFVGVIALLGLIGSSDPLSIAVCIILAIGCAAVLVFSYLKIQKAKESDAQALAEIQRQHKQECDAIMAQYQNSMAIYENNCNVFENNKQEFLRNYVIWRNIYLQHAEEEAEIEEKLESDRLAAVQKIHEEKYIPAKQELDNYNDLISERYLPVLDIIIELIESNRADDLKEAVNLYEELVYRERQLQLQREQEEQRRYEEELRRQDEERRHREEMQFRENQERQRRQDEERREREAERRHNEEMRQRETEERRREQIEKERLRKQELTDARRKREEEDRLWKAGSAQCRACAYAGHCNMSIHNKTPNCTGFRPR